MCLKHCLIVAVIATLGYLVNASTALGVSPKSIDRVEIPIAALYPGFQNPPAEARPFVRWWWNNNQVEAKEILRELDLIKEAGFGGVEINPIAAREKIVQSQAKVLSWRSEEWDKMLHIACKGAQERGMIVDLIAGSGWPFGGEFLKPEEQIMRVSIVHQKVQGPQTFSQDPASVIKRAPKRHGKHVGEARIEFVKLYPASIASIKQVRDITEKLSPEGRLTVEIPSGEFVVVFGVHQQGYRQVVNGAVGAKGPTMDHLQKRVTRMYLDQLRGVEETWGEPLSNYVRAIFCDSIETGAANWTHGILDAFKQRKGYDISPYLPFVIDGEDPASRIHEAFRDQVRRARYDWNAFQVEVFLKNFTSEYSAFCHNHGLLSRYQAYGTPYLMGMAEGYLIPDIPESNNWLYTIDPYNQDRFTSNYDHGYMIWTKYTSAGGRLRGKKIISTEAMTNTREVFHCTLGTIKQADDMNFITGMTHSVLHGFNYVPPDIPFPGLIRYGSFFSGHNTWWPYLCHWVDYNARISYVLQNTQPVSDIAIIGPTPDLWSQVGLVRQPFHVTPSYLHKLWEPIAQLGSTCDYLHEAVIQQADTRDGLLRYGPMAYRVLLVVDMKSMQPETAEAIQRLAERGGKIVYVNQSPSRAPGLVEAAANDQRVQQAVTATRKAGASLVSAPKDDSALRSWAQRVLSQVGYQSDVVIEQPRDGLYHIRHQALGEEILFFTNTYRKESSRTRIAFELGSRGLWRWNPETGGRSPYDLPYDASGFELDLYPLESILLVTGKKVAPAQPRSVSTEEVEAFAISTPWTVTFNPAQSQDTFTLELGGLSEFTEYPDERVQKFSGTVVYKTTFSLRDQGLNQLELGWDNDFISDITINGQPVGVNWYGSKRFDVGSMLKPGSNTLVIHYTTTLYNKMKGGQPTGLMGPVRLIAHRP